MPTQTRVGCARRLGLGLAATDEEVRARLREEQRLAVRRLNGPTADRAEAQCRLDELAEIREALGLQPGDTARSEPARLVVPPTPPSGPRDEPPLSRPSPPRPDDPPPRPASWPVPASPRANGRDRLRLAAGLALAGAVVAVIGFSVARPYGLDDQWSQSWMAGRIVTSMLLALAAGAVLARGRTGQAHAHGVLVGVAASLAGWLVFDLFVAHLYGLGGGLGLWLEPAGMLGVVAGAALPLARNGVPGSPLPRRRALVAGAGLGLAALQFLRDHHGWDDHWAVAMLVASLAGLAVVAAAGFGRLRCHAPAVLAGWALSTAAPQIWLVLDGTLSFGPLWMQWAAVGLVGVAAVVPVRGVERCGPVGPRPG